MPTTQPLAHSSQVVINDHLYSFFLYVETFRAHEELKIHHWTARLSSNEGATYSVLTSQNDAGHHIIISIGLCLRPMANTTRIERTALPSRVRDVMLELIGVVHFTCAQVDGYEIEEAN